MPTPTKRPAAALPPARAVYKTHLTRCFCSSSYGLKPGHEINVILYGMSGIERTIVQSFRCSSSGCRKTYGRRILFGISLTNIALPAPRTLKRSGLSLCRRRLVLTVEHLKHHSFLQFRACVSASAIKHTYQHTFDTVHGEQSNWFAKMHTVAIMSWVAVQELYPLQLHLSIKIGDEITPQALHAYNQYLQFKVFPPKRRRIVKKLVTCR